jgi:hypothetical protein
MIVLTIKKKLAMKKWLTKNKFYFLGGAIGGLAGFLYWKLIVCSSGSCAITSSPINSTIYFAAMGALFVNIIKKENKPKQQQHDN